MTTRSDGRSGAGTPTAPRPPARSIAEIRADIERDRADLASSVEVLAARLDVRARTRDAAARARARVRQRVGALRPQAGTATGRADGGLEQGGTPVAGILFGLSAAAVVAAYVIWRKVRR